MPGSSSPTENELSGNFGTSFSHNVMSGLFLKYILNFLFYLYIFSSLNPPHALCIYYDLQFSLFMKLRSVQASESLFFVPCLGNLFVLLVCFYPILMC